MHEKIKALREQHGLTLEEVGRAVGVGKSTVRKWENGIIENMRRDKIAALAEILQTTPAYLMGWEEVNLSGSEIIEFHKIEKPATDYDDGLKLLDAELIRMLKNLSPDEAVQVRAFVQGLKCRKE